MFNRSAFALPLLIISWLIMQQAYAQPVKYSNEYMRIGVSARAFALSNAYTAIADEAAAVYWNPAALPQLQSNRQLALMHAEYFAGIAKYDFGGFAAKLDDKNSLGIAFIRFAVDDIPNTTELIDYEGNFHYDKLYSFSAADNAVLISFARQTPVKGLTYGVTSKIIRRKAGDFASCWGFGLDAGMHYKRNTWQFAFVMRDMSTTFNAWSYTLSDNMKEIFTQTGNAIPVNTLELTQPSAIIGIAKEFTIKEKFTCLLTTDMTTTFDGKRNVLIAGDPVSIDPSAGIELGFKKIFFIRAGIGNFQQQTNDAGTAEKTRQLNMGVGINIKNSVIIDYALTDLGDNALALYSNIVSLRLNFNKKQSGEKSKL